jgi:hypothetical protein
MAKCLELARPMCDEAQASIPTRHGSSFWKNAKTARPLQLAADHLH